MKDQKELRHQVELVLGGLTDLNVNLKINRPYSKAYIRGVLDDLIVHASAALFQIDCVSGETSTTQYSAANR